MAYMTQERKAKIAASLKGIIPKDWKYSLSVHHHSSTICLTIRSAPVNLIAERAAVVNDNRVREGDQASAASTYAHVNHYYIDREFRGDLLKTFEAINAALNDGNHDRSDSQSDYFDVGWYVDISIGRWDKPFIYTAAAVAA